MGRRRPQGVKSHFDIIYADPPWRFLVRSAKGDGRSASRHYPTMTLADIKALDVAGLAAPDSVLLLWVIDPMLDQAMEVLDAWGFRFRTVGFYWVKTNADGSFFMGTGYHTRANPEQCWIARRGAGLPRLARDVPRLLVAPRGPHSRKPPETRDRIERLYGCRPRVELFARERVKGWAAWGNEVEGTIRL